MRHRFSIYLFISLKIEIVFWKRNFVVIVMYFVMHNNDKSTGARILLLVAADDFMKTFLFLFMLLLGLPCAYTFANIHNLNVASSINENSF